MSTPESTPAAAVQVRASAAQESAVRQSVVDSKAAGSGSATSMPACLAYLYTMVASSWRVTGLSGLKWPLSEPEV